MTRMNVSIEDALVTELRSLVPVKQRSRFISAAVEEKLARLKQEQAVRSAAGAWSAEGRETPEAEIRSLRQGWGARDERLGESGG